MWELIRECIAAVGNQTGQTLEWQIIGSKKGLFAEAEREPMTEPPP